MKNFNYTDGGYQIKMGDCTVVPHYRPYVYVRVDTVVLKTSFPPDCILHPQKIHYIFL